MADLLGRTARKADAPMPIEELRRRNGAGAVHQMVTQGLFNAAPVRSPGVENILGGVGLTQRSSKPADAQKAERPTLHPAVVEVQRGRNMSFDTAHALSMIVEAHERAKGEEITFTCADMGQAIGVSAQKAAEVVDDLLRARLIVRRTSSLGSTAGYVPALS